MAGNNFNGLPPSNHGPGFPAANLLDPGAIPSWMTEFQEVDDSADEAPLPIADEPVSQIGVVDGTGYAYEWEQELEVLQREARARHAPDPAQVRQMARMLILNEPQAPLEPSQDTGREAEISKDERDRLVKAAQGEVDKRTEDVQRGLDQPITDTELPLPLLREARHLLNDVFEANPNLRGLADIAGDGQPLYDRLLLRL